jgi:hypothetical protein
MEKGVEVQTVVAIMFGASALGGTVITALDPSKKLETTMRGKTQREIREHFERRMRSEGLVGTTVFVLWLIAYLFTAYVYFLLVIPGVAVVALTTEVGARELGYVVLVLTAINWYRIFLKKPPGPTIEESPPEGRPRLLAAAGQEILKEPPAPNRHPAVRAATRLILSLCPTTYVWYVFLASIGVVR